MVAPYSPEIEQVGGAASGGRSAAALTAAEPMDSEMGGVPLYDDDAWRTGTMMRDSTAFTEEDFVPATLARQRLQAVVQDMDAMRKNHHAMMIEVRKNYETIGVETKGYYTKYIGDLSDRYNVVLSHLKKDADVAKQAEMELRAEVVPLREEVHARALQVNELEAEVEKLDAARSAVATEAQVAKVAAADVAEKAAEELAHHEVASAAAAAHEEAAVAEVEAHRMAEREALEAGNAGAVAAAKADREAAEGRARAAEESSKLALADAQAAQQHGRESAAAHEEAVMEEVVQQSAPSPPSADGPMTPRDDKGPRVHELEASVAALEVRFCI